MAIQVSRVQLVPWRRVRPLSRLVSICLVAAVFGGCSLGSSGQPPASDSAASSAWSESLTRWLSSADAQVYPVATREILRRAAEEGELSFALYDQSVKQWADCVRAVGVEPIVGNKIKTSGVEVYSTSIQYPPGSVAGSAETLRLDAATNECRGPALRVEVAYMEQPTALAERGRIFEEWRDRLHECLLSAGSVLKRESSRELYDTELQRLVDTKDCEQETGYWAVK